MQLKFLTLKLTTSLPPNPKNIVLLTQSSWDDYSFKTSFHVTLYNSNGIKIDLGTTKIGYISQQHGWTSEKLDDEFTKLGVTFFL